MLFALEFNYGSDYTPTISELMGTNVLKNNYCSFKTIPICKVKGTYYCNPIWTMPTCSYKNGHVLGEYYQKYFRLAVYKIEQLWYSISIKGQSTQSGVQMFIFENKLTSQTLTGQTKKILIEKIKASYQAYDSNIKPAVLFERVVTNGSYENRVVYGKIVEV